MKIPKLIKRELDASAQPWRIEKGGNHYKIFINNRLASILPYGSGDAHFRSVLNGRAQIRRALRGDRA